MTRSFGGRRPNGDRDAQQLSSEDIEARLGGSDPAGVAAVPILTDEEVEARVGVPATAATRVRRSQAGQAEPALYGTTRRRILWRDSATILTGVVLALFAARFLLPSDPASALGSPSPEDTGLVALASPTPTPTPTDPGPATIGPVVPPSLHLDATPTPIPVITLPPATPRPTPTPTLKPGQTPGPTPSKTPTPTPHTTPAPTPLAAPLAQASCSVAVGSFQANCTSAGTVCGGTCTYHWTFGDGTTGTGKTVSHIYPVSTPITYTVTLTVTNSAGSDTRNAFPTVPGV